MKFSKKRWGYTFAACALSLTCIGLPSQASKQSELQSKSNILSKELSGINGDIQSLASKIAQSEVAIEETTGEIEKTEELLLIAQAKEQKQYEDMKARIKYMYENEDGNFLTMILGASDMDDLINKVDFVQDVNSYDRQMLQELTSLKQTIIDQQTHLEEEQAAQIAMQEELTGQKNQLTKKAAETATDLNKVNGAIEQLKEQQRKADAEKARKEAEEAAKKAAQEKNKKVEEANKTLAESKKKEESKKQETTTKTETKKDTTTQTTTSPSSNNSSNDNVSSNSGGLTKSKGVVYYNGHRETYYSQKVLPGNGLKIPGRHVAADGTIRDADGYICVASSDLAKGTVVQTSLGPGKVYDSGCASGTIDLYTNW